MSNVNVIIAYTKPWYGKIVSKLIERHSSIQFHAVESPRKLTLSYLKKINPKYIFFPHWSNIIPKEIHENFNCVIFHMTDVPFGRGGSPLQNLIARGIYETKISAVQCVKELDAGAVYLKVPLSLYGNAEEIYLRTASTITEMIASIIDTNPKPIPQIGDVVKFKRRQPYEGNMAELDTLEQVHDYIRMLDAEGYPRAFIEMGKFIFEFERSALKEGEICADVRIKLKEVDKK